ncbi:hypothetical protein C2G38_2249933 [Gigaspora rosea]|uniref:Uncharacterized protein n=1 Tax=Gigaspora rosea TaxID=44941 RepID=A0A397UR06_9GLOM|nr:hypothetical protein C2G38_2249933 [Gigaspora rosea]
MERVTKSVQKIIIPNRDISSDNESTLSINSFFEKKDSSNGNFNSDKDEDFFFEENNSLNESLLDNTFEGWTLYGSFFQESSSEIECSE